MKTTLKVAVTTFLRVALLPSEYKGKVAEYRLRENNMRIIGYNQAQEDFRQILSKYGFAELAEMRSPKQRKPEVLEMEDGKKINLWL